MISTTTAERWKNWFVRWTPALIGTAICAFFLASTWPGLFVGLDADDLMNLHFAWQPGLSKLALSNLVPFSSLYRPLGSAYYRTCYAVFGWSPGAFRTVTYALMILNLYLVYLLARRLTESREVAAMAALLFSFHAELRQIYLSNGTVYDVLCATLTLLTLWFYAWCRREGRSVGVWQAVLITALTIAAVNAKEMAATLPALLFLYEWFYYGAPWKTGAERGKRIFRSIGLLAVLCAVVISAAWGKLQSDQFHGHPLYTPSFTAHRLLEHERFLLGLLFYGRHFTTALVIVFYAALFAGAAVTRKRCLWFTAWFALLAPLPVIFIPPRGFFVMYLPMAGIAIYFAVVLVKGRDWIWRVVWKRAPLGLSPWEPERIFLFLFIAFALTLQRDRNSATALQVQDPSMRFVQDTHDDIVRLNEPLPEGARILLLYCRFPPNTFGPLQMMQLLYGDRDLWVERPSMMTVHATPDIYPQYDRVIDFDGKKWFVVQRRKAPAGFTPVRYPRH